MIYGLEHFTDSEVLERLKINFTNNDISEWKEELVDKSFYYILSCAWDKNCITYKTFEEKVNYMKGMGNVILIDYAKPTDTNHQAQREKIAVYVY